MTARRRPPWTSSMIAMALLACGESVARAAPVDEQEQKRMEWARQQAVSRIFSIEEMRQYLRSAGDDEAKAEEHLPQTRIRYSEHRRRSSLNHQKGRGDAWAARRLYLQELNAHYQNRASCSPKTS